MEQTAATWARLWGYATNAATRTVNHGIIAWALGVPEAEVTRLVNEHVSEWQAHPMLREGFGKVVAIDGNGMVGWTPNDHRTNRDRWIPGDVRGNGKRYQRPVK